MKKVTKVVIPVAGLGTRMLPATKAVPKEMLPLADKPIIQYIVDECIAAGLYDIVLVTHSSKNSIENHFDTSFELESTLEKRVKRTLLEEIRKISPKHVNIMHIRQGIAKGLGHAILTAFPLIGNEPVAVILPDVVINSNYANPNQTNLSAMLQRYHTSGINQIMVEEVPLDLVERYGIANCSNNGLTSGESSPITSLVEKPKKTETQSRLAIVGRYVLSETIWSCLNKTPLGIEDEIQLTDALSLLMAQEQIEAYHLIGKSHDCGNKLGYFQAFVEYCQHHPELGNTFKQWLQQQIF